MSTNEELFEDVLTAINEMHGDTSVDLNTALRNLLTLKDEIEVLVDATEFDIAQEERAMMEEDE